MRLRAPILLALLLVLATVALALLQCGAWDGSVNGDGVSYLDLARLYSHGQLSALANGYWSPLYPMLLAAALRASGAYGPQPLATLLTPEMRVVFAVNVLVMACAAAAFGRLLIALHRALAPAPRAVTVCRVLAASALFLWCTIRFIGATAVTPDALLTTWLLLVAAELVDASVQPPSAARTLRAAVFLAAGYWTKAVFFPVAVVVLGAYLAAVLHADRRAWRLHLARGLAPVLLLVTPLVVVQSAAQHRLSFGETGRLNYRWYVLGAPHAPASNDASGALAARATSELRQPAALPLAAGTTLFRGDVAGSFPYWFDPSRFEPRDAIRIDARAQWERLAYNAHWYRVVAAPFVVLALVAFAASLAREKPSARLLLPALPAAMLILLYALTHVEGRLAGPPILLLLVLLLHLASSHTAPSTAPAVATTGVPTRAPAWRRACVVAECAALVALGVLAVGRTAKRVPTGSAGARAARLASPAAELRARGVAEGSSIGIVGSPYGHYWAHQAGVRLAVVTPAVGAAPMGDAELAAIAVESCARGAPLGAIVGHERDDVRSRDAVALASGWWMWRPTTPCPRVSTR